LATIAIVSIAAKGYRTPRLTTLIDQRRQARSKVVEAEGKGHLSRHVEREGKRGRVHHTPFLI